MIRKPFITVIGLVLLLLGACKADEREASRQTGPALWKIEKDGQKGFIFGTIHVLPRDTDWQTQALRQAMASSDRLVLEASGLDDVAKTQKIFDEMGLSAGLPPLAARVPASDRPALEALAERGGMRTDDLSRYESWAAALRLATVGQSDSGVSGDDGVEPTLTKAFKAEDKPILGLETVGDQFALFDRLPEEVQRRLLRDTVEQGNAGKDDYAQMLRAWLAGDMKVIARDFVADLAPEPELARPLLTDRNRKWAARIPLLPGRPFIAVGAAHLAGPDNLLTLLEQQGYKVTKIQ